MLISTACTRISIHTIIQCAGLYISRENDYHLWVRHNRSFCWYTQNQICLCSGV